MNRPCFYPPGALLLPLNLNLVGPFGPGGQKLQLDQLLSAGNYRLWLEELSSIESWKELREQNP